MSEPSPDRSSRRYLWGLATALGLWGVYLAIGATGVFTDVGLLDVRRSLIVLACTTGFVGFWMWVLGRQNQPIAPHDATQPSFSRASIGSGVAAVTCYILWGLAWLVWDRAPGNIWNALFGYAAAASFGVAAVLALVGLSDPLPRRGKLLGLATLLLLLIAVVAFIIQVQRFAAGQPG